jgi:hypothetical protein
MTASRTAVTNGAQSTALSLTHPASGDHVLLRGAGVAGSLGGLLVLAAFGVVCALGLPDTSTTASLLRFPEIHEARAAENLLYLAGVVLWAVHFDLLHRLLRGTAPMLSAAARTVGLLGAAALAAGTLLNVSTAPMSLAYQEAAEADRAGIVAAWQAAQGVLDAMLTVGALLLPAAVVLFGLALPRHVGRVLRWVLLVVGTGGVAGAAVAGATPPSALVAAGILATLVFHLSVGIRWLRLCRS